MLQPGMKTKSYATHLTCAPLDNINSLATDFHNTQILHKFGLHTCQHALLAQQWPPLFAACILPPKRCTQDALIYHAGAHSTVLAGLLPSRRFSPSPCCHSPDSPSGALAPRSSGNTRACCAPHPANGVEGARVWGDAASFRVGPGSSYNQA